MCAKNGVIRFLILFVVKNLICQHYFCIINVILQEIELGFPKLMYNISTFYHNLIDYMSFTAIAGSPSENYEMLQWIIKHIKSISRILFSRKIWPKIFAFCVSISFMYVFNFQCSLEMKFVKLTIAIYFSNFCQILCYQNFLPPRFVKFFNAWFCLTIRKKCIILS